MEKMQNLKGFKSSKKVNRLEIGDAFPNSEKANFHCYHPFGIKLRRFLGHHI